MLKLRYVKQIITSADFIFRKRMSDFLIVHVSILFGKFQSGCCRQIVFPVVFHKFRQTCEKYSVVDVNLSISLKINQLQLIEESIPILYIVNVFIVNNTLTENYRRRGLKEILNLDFTCLNIRNCNSSAGEETTNTYKIKVYTVQ